MAAAAGIFNHGVTAAQVLMGRTMMPAAEATAGTSSSSSSTESSSSTSSISATISANDFLTLLVTEMQNQDPTSDTDPNEYIDQLVQVNSLEQLIDINQTLSTAMGSTSSGANASSAGTEALHPADTAAHTTQPASLTAAISPNGTAVPANDVSAGSAQGNLSASSTSSAAERVAHALDGRPHAQTIRNFAARQ